MGRDLAAQPASVLAKSLPSSSGSVVNGRYSYRISQIKNDATVNDQELRGYMYVGRFSIDLTTLTNDAKLRTVCGHEFLHLVQNLYEFSAPNVEPEQKWLKEATSVWIMEKFSSLPYYVPHSITNRETYLFDGWQYKDRGYARHGYGMSVLFKDIEETYGVDKIIQMFKLIEDGTLPSSAVDPVDAVLAVINDPVEVFWHGVVGSYLLGHYYNHQVNTVFLDKSTSYAETVTIDPQNSPDPLRYYLHDLSAKLFKVKPGDLSSANSLPLSFTVTDPVNCGILVCKYKQGSNIELLGEAAPGESGEVVLEDAKPVFDDGYELVVMVTNCTHNKELNYQGGNDVTLTIATEPSDILTGKFELYLDDAEFHHSDSTYPVTGPLNIVLHLNNVRGSFGTSTFHGSYSYESLGRLFSGYVNFTFLDDPSRINVHIDNTMVTESSSHGTRTYEYTVDYAGIPYTGTNPMSGNFEYEATGGSVQAAVVTWEEVNSIYTSTYYDCSCGPASYIRLSVDSRPLK